MCSVSGVGFGSMRIVLSIVLSMILCLNNQGGKGKNQNKKKGFEVVFWATAHTCLEILRKDRGEWLKNRRKTGNLNWGMGIRLKTPPFLETAPYKAGRSGHF
jgi:hypothetical protein